MLTKESATQISSFLHNERTTTEVKVHNINKTEWKIQLQKYQNIF